MVDVGAISNISGHLECVSTAFCSEMGQHNKCELAAMVSEAMTMDVVVLVVHASMTHCLGEAGSMPGKDPGWCTSFLRLGSQRGPQVWVMAIGRLPRLG